MKQVSFASLAYEGRKKQTRKDKFLTEMDQIIPWKKLTRLIEPHFPKRENGRTPMGVQKMLRIYFRQQWFNLSDPVPDETTILKFRHLLEKHDLTAKLFEVMGGYLEKKGLLLREGTIVDATLIAAPSSTKNNEKKRDPEMTQTKKGNQWYFGMKAHTGTDPENRVVHTIGATPKCATAGSTKMRRSCLPSLAWPTSTWCERNYFIHRWSAPRIGKRGKGSTESSKICRIWTNINNFLNVPGLILFFLAFVQRLPS
ncbi:MAG: transposase [Thermoleophilia bacterium]